MKKTGRSVIFLWIIVAALISGLSVMVSPERLKSAEVHAGSSDNTDGVYTIEGRLWHAAMDQPSMGNSALVQPMKIVKSGGNVTLQMEFRSLNSGVFAGYLYSIHYFPSWDKEEEAPNGAESVPATVTAYYDGVYDSYNHPSTGMDDTVRGKWYPHYAVMPVRWNAASTWVQVYVPVMEAVSTGSGKQYARLLLDWNTLKKTEEKAEDIVTSPADPSSGIANAPVATAIPAQTTVPKNDSGKNSRTGNKKLQIGSLKDGTYTITGKMVKADRKTKSMSDEAVSHNIILTVKKGKYSLTMSLSGLTVGGSKGYLSKLKYFKTGYKMDKKGVPAGKKKAVTIHTYQRDDSGKKISDSYGTDYPAKVTFPMITEAKKDGYVPLQVFVPIMEAISAGTGTQPVYLKLDLSSITSGKKNNSKAIKSAASSGSGSKKKKASAETKSDSASDAGKVVKGTVYSCQIVPSYKHPVTGSVEDSGGASSYATGQGMVESVMGTSGMLEETESGAYYLTVRMSLMDMTSKHTFRVQKRGDSHWDPVSATVTRNGSDKNGKTSDFCFSVPDKDSIVRASMYVEPMGRNVIFYASLKNLKKGQPKDMKATKVSEDAADENHKETEDDPGNDEGLSLSTEGAEASDAGDADSTEKNAGATTGAGGGMSFGKWLLALTLSVTLSGLLLMSAGAGLVYYFRRNWRRWGEEMMDDED